MTGPTESSDTSLERFAARVAHDLNNLLTGILGNLELLQLRATRNRLPGLDSYFEGANGAGSRAVAFAGRLMLYSGRGGIPPVPVPVDEVLARFTAQARCSLAAGDASVLCDPAQLELAITELLANAAAGGGQDSIASAVAGEDAIVTISDTGRGMSAETLACAGEPFFTTHANGTGRGLGLSIVARVVRDIGGTLHIESAEGAGCTVTLRLARA